MEAPMERKTCAFTGHRPSKLPWRYNETAEGCVRLKETLAAQISALADSGVTDFLSGMALGIDQICAELILVQREKNPALKLHCILPCMGQDAKWSDSARRWYRSIIQRADSRVYVSRAYHKDCMMQRNKFLVEHSACLLAVYNGDGLGGTAATVNFARKQHREIIVIDPVSCRVTHEQ